MRMAYNNGGRMVTRVYSAVSTAATKHRGKRAKKFTDEGKATERKHQEDSVTPVLRSERAILHQASSREKEQSLRFAQVYTQSSIRRAKDRKHPRQLQHALCFLAASLVYASLPTIPFSACTSLAVRLYTHIYTPATHLLLHLPWAAARRRGGRRRRQRRWGQRQRQRMQGPLRTSQGPLRTSQEQVLSQAQDPARTG